MKRRACPSCCGEYVGHEHSTTCNVCHSVKTELQQRINKLVSAAVKRGEIPPAKSCACVDCGMPAKDYDHREYGKPLTVVPVCRSCNLRRGAAIDVFDLVRHERAAA